MDELLNTTHPYETTSPGVTRHQCVECGGWERSDKNGGQIRHSKRCDSRPQPGAIVGCVEQNEQALRGESLKAFGRNVRRTGMTLGRDADVLKAVRDGHLSENDAMNTDD